MNTLTTKTSGDFFFLRGVSHEYVNNSVYPEPATIRSSRVHGTHSFLIPYTNQSYADNDNRYHIVYNGFYWQTDVVEVLGGGGKMS